MENFKLFFGILWKPLSMDLVPLGTSTTLTSHTVGIYYELDILLFLAGHMEKCENIGR